MFKSRARKFADMFSTSLADVLEGGALDKTAVGGLTAVEAKADANAETVSALHSVATTGDYNDLSNKPAADITGVTAGGGLTGGGTSGDVTINHQDTSSQGSVNNSGNTVIQDVTLDTYGHVTSLVSKTISAGASTTAGGVGTYAWLIHMTASKTWSIGSSHSGSSMRYSAVGSNSYNNKDGAIWKTASGTPSGTWRAMCTATAPSGYETAGLFIRIS